MIGWSVELKWKIDNNLLELTEEIEKKRKQM